ncbi:MAG TPA: ABC-2 family transporter protein [Polyangiaceae bacterium]|nr:ABC-2 family transporter protein [Polyangiaceae bacterium]
MRYLRLLAVQLRISLVLSMQYRADFLLDGFIEIFWMATAIVPLYVVYHLRPSVAGWTFGDSLMVMGWFTFLQGVLEGAINPSLVAVVEHIRKGTLDFVLVKPADAQFLVSTTRFQPWRAVNVVTSIGVFAWGFHLIGRTPSATDVLFATVAMFVAVVVLYSLWIVTVCAAFYFVRIDNLTQLFVAVFDAARWPIAVFRGAVRLLFTFVVPLALMTTYPAEALLGWLSPVTLVASVVGALVAFGLSRVVWLRSIGRYTSAGG